MLLVDGVRWLLKTYAMKLSLIGEDKVTDQICCVARNILISITTHNHCGFGMNASKSHRLTVSL
jgi:hypothetical protein